MNFTTDQPNSYRVEVSGWDASENFFVEKTMLNWGRDEKKELQLRSAIREGSVVFVRLLQPLASGNNFPVACGGFWLARPASEISLADIIRAIDGPLVGVRGERPENLGYIGAAEPLQTVWIALRANERAILEDVTLHHIVSGQLPDRVAKLAEDPRAWA